MWTLRKFDIEQPLDIILQELKAKVEEFMLVSDHLLEQQHTKVQEEVSINHRLIYVVELAFILIITHDTFGIHFFVFFTLS